MEACTFHSERRRRVVCANCQAGLCASCSRTAKVCPVCKKPKLRSLAAETVPFNEPAALRAERERLAGRKKARTKRFGKGKGRTARRLVIGAVVASAFLGIFIWDYQQFVKFTEMAGKKAAAMRAMNQGKGDDFARLMERVNKGTSSQADVAETEDLMKQVENGTAQNSLKGGVIQLRERIEKAQAATGSPPQLTLILSRMKGALSPTGSPAPSSEP